jgi:hypothetical protein
MNSMNIYFTASVSAKNKYLIEYKNIIGYLETLGHTVTSKHITDITESQIQEESREEILRFQTKVEQWIKKCDCIIADTSFPSVSVGYEIALALRIGKPILVFYGEGGPPSLLTYYKDEKLITEKYSDAHYKDIIENFINFVRGKTELRFTFFITSAIAVFLDEVARKEKLPKAVYIRKLIEKDMRHHRFMRS